MVQTGAVQNFVEIGQKLTELDIFARRCKKFRRNRLKTQGCYKSGKSGKSGKCQGNEKLSGKSEKCQGNGLQCQ